MVVEVLDTLRELGQDHIADRLDDYAEAAERIAALDVNKVLRRAEIDSKLEAVVIGAAIGDTLLAALRRLAQENASAQATPAA
jgi:hypothetical protein